MNTEWDAATGLLDQAVALYPGIASTWNERARFQWGRGNLREALADFDEARKLEPGDYWIAIDRANLLLEMNRRREALEEFTRAIRINPNEYQAYAYTAGLKDDFGDHDGAARDYEILARLNPKYYFGLEGLGFHQMRKGQWAPARDTFMEAYRQAPEEHIYALLAAINWMRAEDVTAPRAYLGPVVNRVRRDSLEWFMFRLFHDLSARNYLGENDMMIRLEREENLILKARMSFYMAQYFDIRGNVNSANRYYQTVFELDQRAIPEWRLNDWIMSARNLKPF
jgi:tetratricopeptide (TPR) repeat protein